MAPRISDLQPILSLLRHNLNCFEQLYYVYTQIPFEIPAYSAHGRFPYIGGFFRFTDGNSFRFPLATYDVVQGSEHEFTVRQEIPSLLLQVITAYQRNPESESYTGFMISMREKSSVRLTKAVVSASYVQRLLQNKPPGERMEVYRSELYDIVEPEGRRGVLMLMMGLTNHLVAAINR